LSYRYPVQAGCTTVRCYCDEAHDSAAGAPNAGQGTPGVGCSSFGDRDARGQLIDGVRGVDDAIANLGNGIAFEWVGWNGPVADVIFTFSAPRAFSAVTLGINNKDPPNVTEPSEVRISFSDDGTTFGTPLSFKKSDGTLPQIPTGLRADVRLSFVSRSARFVKVTLLETVGASWMFLDEIGFE
jgi:hypothetical protein